MQILITSSCGFVGSHVTEHLLKNTDHTITGLDRYSISGTQHRLTEMDRWQEFYPRVNLVTHDLRCPINQYVANRIGSPDIILHLAASSSVDRSISDPLSFVYDNVIGTCNILNFARTLPGLKWFNLFSTDEVFGPAPEGTDYKEWDRYRSGNPYAATKAGSEELAISFENTYKLPVFVTHTMNVFGERQHPEKFIPSTINKVLRGEKVIIHADKTKTKSGSRFYIHTEEVARALAFLIDNAKSGEKYNIVGERETSNLELAQAIAGIVGKPLKYEFVDFHSARSGHDLRYSLCGAKLASMGFKFKRTWNDSLRETVRWYLNNRDWL